MTISFFGRPKALSLASIAVDCRVGEAVDLTQIVTGWIPKEIFLEPWTGSFAGGSGPGHDLPVTSAPRGRPRR